MSIAELRKLLQNDKLKTLEALWSDLAGDPEPLESPTWHEDELRQTEKAFEEGQIESIDWETAKTELQTQFE